MAKSKPPGPSLRAQWLGQQLRRKRETSGTTLREAGAYLQRDSSVVSRYESAEYPIRRGDVIALLNLYGVSDGQERDILLQLSEDMWQRGWWDEYTDTVKHQFVDFAWLESRAEKIRTYEAMAVPGMLQIPEYAASIIRATDDPAATDDQLKRMVELRMTRQQVVAGDEPRTFETVIDESVLRRTVGGDAVMRAQLEALLTAAKQPHIQIRVLPSSVGAHPGMDGSFHLFDMTPPYPAVAFVNNLAGNVYVEDPDQVERFQRAYDQLWKAALGPKKSIEHITSALEDRRDTPDGTNP